MQEVAPSDLLKVIRCNCKISLRNPCGSGLCSCRTNSLSCVAACGDCKGINCSNVSQEKDIGEEDNLF